MQCPVHGQVRKMRIQRLPLSERLARDYRRTKHDVALHRAAGRNIGKSEHIWRIVAAAIAAVESPRFRGSDDPHGDLPRHSERGAGPAADLYGGGNEVGTRSDLEVKGDARPARTTRRQSWSSV